jgi:hypothetical protein
VYMRFALAVSRRLGSARTRQMVLSLAVVLGLGLFSQQSFAQSNLGRIFGAVTDQSGGAIVGASVSVIDVARGITRPLVTDGAGQFDASSIIPGTYTVRAEAAGFKVEEHTAIDVGVGKEVRVDLTLQPGEQTTTVTVTGDLPLVNTSNAQLGGTLENITVSELPVNGRNYQYLAFTRPGVVMSPGEGQNDFSTDGIRVQYVVWMIDGLIDSNLFVGSPSLVGGAQLGADEATILPLDAIQEVNMIENAGAAYGDKPGAHIDVGLKSGTNSVHGTAYAFGRDTGLNAKNPFLLPTEPKAPLQMEQFGASIGGPIKKDRVFFFANYEGQRYTVGVPKIQSEPTTASYAGTAFANSGTTDSIPDAVYALLHNTLGPGGTVAGPGPSALSLNLSGCASLVKPGYLAPGGYLNATGVTSLTALTNAQIAAGCNPNPLQDIFGSGAVPGSGLLAGQIVTDFTSNGGSDNGIIKVDVHANDKNQLNFVWYSGGGGEISATTAEQYWASDLHTWANMGRAVWIWTPNSTFLNEFRFGYDYGNYPVYVYECDHSVGPNYAALGLVQGAKPCQPESSGPNRDVYGGYFAQTISGGFATLGGSGIRQDSFQHYFSILNNSTWTHGKHVIKFGPEIRLAYFDSAALVNDNGAVTFGSTVSAFGTAGTATPLEDFMAGVPSSGSLLTGDPNRNTYVPSFGAYVEDTWRVLPRLTITAGVRYEFTWPWSNPGTNPGGQPAYLLGNFDPSLGTATDLYQETKNTPVYHQYPFNFGPRLGLAWDVFGDGKTVVHAGGSVMENSAPRGIQVLYSGGAQINAVPTGFTFYDAANPGGFQGPGTIKASPLNPQGGLPPAYNNGGVASTGNTLPWTVGNPVFQGNSQAAFACGDGYTTPTSGISLGAKTVSPCAPQVINPNFKVGYYTFWAMSVQHAFTNNLTLDVAYVGDRGTDLDGLINENPPSLGNKTTSIPAGGCAGVTLNEQCRRPYEGIFPFYGNILLSSQNEESSYNALQVSMTQRLSHGLQITPAFTYSHALDNTSVGYPQNPMLYYGSSGNPLVFTLTGTYYLPSKKSPAQLLEGWQVNTTVYFLSAGPTTLTDTSDDISGTGANLDRWDIVGNPKAFKLGSPSLAVPCFGVAGSSFAKAPNCTSVPTVSAMPAGCLTAATQVPNSPASVTAVAGQGTTGLAQLANYGCYIVGNTVSPLAVLVPPSQGTLGNEGTGTFYGKPYRNWDFSATKNWKFKERYGLQFRAEFFNILNRTLISGAGGTNLASPTTLGEATSTPDSGNPVIGNGARKIQLGLKLSF